MSKSMCRVYGCIVFSTTGRLLIVQGGQTQKWSFPKGHKYEFESAHDCALRETWEETGLKLDSLNYVENLQLAAGRYYVYKLENEPAINTCDTNEIIDMRWVKLEDLQNYNYNCDIKSYLMRGHDKRHNINMTFMQSIEKKNYTHKLYEPKTQMKNYIISTIDDDPTPLEINYI